MAESTVVKNFRDGTITIGDGTRTYTIAYEAGDLSLTPPRYDVSIVYDRGEIAGLRHTNMQPGEFSFTMHLRSLSDAGSGNYTILDVLEDTGASTAWTTTGGTGFEARTYTLTWTIEGTDLGDSADHTLVATKCRFLWDAAEGDPNSLNISGSIYGTVTRTGPS